MIKRIVQGQTPETDKELFCLVGGWAISEEVHKILGLGVTGRKDDIWLICPDTGFCQCRMLKSDSIHIRYLYSQEEKTSKLLMEAALKLAKGLDINHIFTNDRKTSTVWKKHGFGYKETKGRGSFVRWERELQ